VLPAKLLAKSFLITWYKPQKSQQRKVEKSLWKAIEFAAQVNQQKILESCQLLETSQSVSFKFSGKHRVSLMHFAKRTGGWVQSYATREGK